MGSAWPGLRPEARARTSLLPINENANISESNNDLPAINTAQNTVISSALQVIWVVLLLWVLFSSLIRHAVMNEICAIRTFILWPQNMCPRSVLLWATTLIVSPALQHCMLEVGAFCRMLNNTADISWQIRHCRWKHEVFSLCSHVLRTVRGDPLYIAKYATVF